MDSNFVSPEVAVHLTSMREQFLTTRVLCSEEASPAETAAAATARVRKSHRPLFSSAIPALVCLRVLLVVLSPLVMYLLLLLDLQVEKGKQVLSSMCVTSMVLLKAESQI